MTHKYVVYVYHRPENYLEGQGDWEMRGMFLSLKAALQEAVALYKSQNFKKIEIAHFKTKSSAHKTIWIFESGHILERILRFVFTSFFLQRMTEP